MLLLIAVVLLLSGTFMYYRATIQLRQCLDKVHPERGSAQRFFVVDELSLISNPVRMYRFIFHGADEVLENPEGLAGIKKRFVWSLSVCGAGALLAGADMLLR